MDARVQCKKVIRPQRAPAIKLHFLPSDFRHVNFLLDLESQWIRNVHVVAHN